MNNSNTLGIRSWVVVHVAVVLLFLSIPRRAFSEDRIDMKALYYQESDHRMQIISPTFMVEHDLSSTLTIKIDGIYNSISGATPSGAPPLKNTTYYSTVTQPGGGGATFVPVYNDDDEDEERAMTTKTRNARTKRKTKRKIRFATGFSANRQVPIMQKQALHLRRLQRRLQRLAGRQEAVVPRQR